jgi:hypothetical protein
VPKGPEADKDELEGKPVSEMSVAELDAFLANERANRAQAANPVIDVEPIGVEKASEPPVG